MDRVVAPGRRVLPRGWRDFGLQLGIWFGFYFTYLAVRSLADRDPAKAFVNGLRVIRFEQHVTHHLFELTVQRVADSSHAPAHRGRLDVLELRVHRHRADAPLGLSPPPRALRPLPQHDPARERHRPRRLLAAADRAAVDVPRLGFVDGVNHSSALLQPFANPYAAMPSLHAADALIVGVASWSRRRGRSGRRRSGRSGRLGLVLRARHREPLPARRPRRNRRRGRLAARHRPARQGLGRLARSARYRKPAIVAIAGLRCRR